MNKKINTGLFWFRQDCRLQDNPALTILCEQVDRLGCVYLTQQHVDFGSQLVISKVNQAKQCFTRQSLIALDGALRHKNQHLIVLDQPVQQALQKVIETYSITHFASEAPNGVYEKKALLALQQTYPDVNFVIGPMNTLFRQETLPFELTDLPATFTPFRKKVENCELATPLQAPERLPPSPVSAKTGLSAMPKSHFAQGGEQAGLKQLDHYLFASHRVKQYKQTRNALDDWASSSKLSLWLANGCLSVRTVFAQLQRYEARHGANDSTYWLYFELLWREFFQWYLAKHQQHLFLFAGVQQSPPATSFNQHQFTRWCEGMTDYPIVNACMRQLNQTGYMSNRGRQLVASCFVHELGLDWRYGAAYFEQQLIDYDVASNWGNWQYLAGVGADPRGHRQFDLAKQTAIYDPNADFRNRWLTA